MAFRFLAVAVTAAFVACVAPGKAEASLIGKQFSGKFTFPSGSEVSINPGTFTVGAGTEATFLTSGPRFDVDMSADSLLLTAVPLSPGLTYLLNPAPFAGFVFEAAAPHGISGVTLAGASKAGFDLSDVEITLTQIRINLAGVRFELGPVDSNDRLPFGVSFTFAAPPPPDTAVPEPASLALLGAGLFGLAAMRRRGRAPAA